MAATQYRPLVVVTTVESTDSTECILKPTKQHQRSNATSAGIKTAVVDDQIMSVDMSVPATFRSTDREHVDMLSPALGRRGVDQVDTPPRGDQ